MRFTFKYILSLLIILQFSNCKKDEESTVLVNASVANSAEGSVSFNSGDYVAGTTVTITATPKMVMSLLIGLIPLPIKYLQLTHFRLKSTKTPIWLPILKKQLTM